MKDAFLSEKEILKILINFYYDAQKENKAFYLQHFSNLVSLKSYFLKGKEVKKYLPNMATVLDWGTGFGQMSLILENLGLDIVSFDISIPEKNLFNKIKAKPILGDKIILPFKNESFDGVVSCGVLEHVSDLEGSLKEIYRVLKKEGYLFIFNFPYKYSPSEFYAFLRKISSHPLKLTRQSLYNILKQNNFTDVKIFYDNGISKRLSGPLKFLKNLYNKFPNFFLFLDVLIVKTPILRNVLSNSLKAIAKK